ncbi:hypothetical protein Tco_0966448 [Tanacetum coccineum]
MAALVIPISSDSSEESVGSHVQRVILFCAIPAIIPVIPDVPAEVPIVPADPLVAPGVGAVFVTSPTGVLELVDYSSSDSDPSEDSLPLAPELLLVSPFLCSDDSEADSESKPAKQRPERHDSLIVHDFLVAHVVAPPEIHRQPAILIQPGEAIPFGRPYRTHPNGPHFTSNLSSSGSSLDSSSDTSLGSPLDSLLDTSSVPSFGCDASRQTHSRPSTRVASSRLVYPPVMTP